MAMYDIKDKETNINILNNQMLNKTLSMFEYENLPDTIPQTELERLLQVNGHCFITEIDGNLYALSGALGGEVDVYNNFTQIAVSNTFLKLSKTFNLANDGVLFSNDDLKIGLMPFFNKINYLLVENDISMVLWGYNSRQLKTLSASDDKTKTSAETYIDKIIKGDLSVIADTPFIDGLKTTTTANSGGAKVNEFLELHQYTKSTLLNELGLSSNHQMKKERLITSEVEEGEDSIFPLVYTMMKNRIDAVKKINEKYDLDIKVGFGSVWALKNKKLVDGAIENEKDKDLSTELETMAIGDSGVDSVDIEAEKELDNTSAAETETDADAETDSDADAETDLDADTETDLDTGDGVELESDTDTDLDPDPDLDPDLDPEKEDDKK